LLAAISSSCIIYGKSDSCEAPFEMLLTFYHKKFCVFCFFLWKKIIIPSSLLLLFKSPLGVTAIYKAINKIYQHQ